MIGRVDFGLRSTGTAGVFLVALLALEMTLDQGFLVVNGISGHEFVLDLESLAGQGKCSLHVGSGMAPMAFLLLSMIGSVDGAC